MFQRQLCKRGLPLILLFILFQFILSGCRVEIPGVPVTLEFSIPEKGWDVSEPQSSIPLEETQMLWKDAPLAVHFLDVGQSDSIFIRCGSDTMLIDAGDIGYGDTVTDYLENQGVTELDYLVMTHPHADHIGGMPEVLETFPVSAVILPEVESNTQLYTRVLELLGEKKPEIKAPVPGDTFSLGEAECVILGPVEKYDDLNNFSVVVKLTYGKTSFLFTGDAEKKAEQDILKSGADVTADVLKLGHHGSSTSSCDDFLDAVDPAMAVITLGEDNSYGFPHKEPMQALKERGIPVYRTDENGNVVVSSDGSQLTVYMEKASGNRETAKAGAQAEGEKEDSYIGNANSKVFHRTGCSSVKKMSEKNKILFSSWDEAVASGFTSCGECEP